QDTIRQDTSSQMEDTLKSNQAAQKDTSEQEQPTQPETTRLDSLTRNDKKEKEQIGQQEREIPAGEKVVREKPEQDTVTALYQITGATEIPVLKRLKKDSSHINFLYNIPETKPDSGKTAVYKNTRNKQHSSTEQTPKPKLLDSEAQQKQDVDWLSILIIAIFIFLGWTRLFFKRYFSILFKSFHFINYAEELYNEKSSFTVRGAAFLNGVHFVVLGLFSLQGVKIFYPSIEIADYKLFGILTGFFILWYIWNAVFQYFVGSVFQKLKTFTEYFYNFNIYRKIAGVILFPFVVINQYIIEEFTIYFIYAGILIFAVIYLMHILRGLQIFIKNKVSILYLILYLCALEFLPLLVLYEGITNEF
ncbi:MAG: DUF4271 domain-containing protein, partial [Bacteroidota bacterium]